MHTRHTGYVSGVLAGELPADVKVIEEYVCSKGGASDEVSDGEAIYVGEKRPNEFSSKGRAMAEIVYDLAPGAKIQFCSGNNTKQIIAWTRANPACLVLFCVAFNSFAQFASCIVNLKNNGSTIIVDDVFYYNEAAYQDDIVAQV